MNLQEDDLYRRICNFDLDESEASFPFSLKLAAECQWTRLYTVRAIQEYKKFMFLGMVADHKVSPSVPIDLIWHLHLIYTDSYWNKFCGDILEKPFHHRPSLGGKEERIKYDLLYQKTLVTYQKFFGTLPADIWLNYSKKNLNQKYWIMYNPIHWLRLGK